MNKGKLLIYIGIMLFSVFISAISQVLLKKAAQRAYTPWWREYLNPFVIAAYAIFFAATLLTMFAYKVVPLSLGAVLETTSYCYVTFFGVKIFGEKVTKHKLFALVLIVFGVLISTLFDQLVGTVVLF